MNLVYPRQGGTWIFQFGSMTMLKCFLFHLFNESTDVLSEFVKWHFVLRVYPMSFLQDNATMNHRKAELISGNIILLAQFYVHPVFLALSVFPFPTYEFVRCTRAAYFVLQPKSLTSTPRPLIPPAPHSVCEALDVGGAHTIVSRVAGEDYFRPILIVRAIDYPPFPMIEGKRAKAGAWHH